MGGPTAPRDGPSGTGAARLPVLPPSQAAPAGLDWYVNSEGMGMLLIAKGSFSMGSEKGDENEGPVQSRTVTSFYLSDREVSVEQFERFIAEKQLPARGGEAAQVARA